MLYLRYGNMEILGMEISAWILMTEKYARAALGGVSVERDGIGENERII